MIIINPFYLLDICHQTPTYLSGLTSILCLCHSRLPSHLAFLLVCLHNKRGPASWSLPFALAVPLLECCPLCSVLPLSSHSGLSLSITFSHISCYVHTSLSDTSCSFLFLIALLTLIYSCLLMGSLSVLPANM